MGKIVLFGATGLVGAYTAIHLKENGYDVVAVGHRKSDNGFFKENGIDYFSVDIRSCNDFNKLPSSNVDSVIHFAGAMPAHMTGYNAQEYVDSIITGTLNVLDYAKKFGAEKIVFSQSISDVSYLFGTAKTISEDSVMKFPLTGDHSVYSISKNAAVNLIQHYQAEYGIKAYILRLPTIYAYHPNSFYNVDGKRKKLGYRLLIEKAEKGDPIEIWGNPENVKELVYVDDFVQLVECCLRAKNNGGIYNVGNDFPHSFDEQIKVMCEVLNPEDKKSEIIYKPDMPSSPQFVLGIEKAKAELGYNPKFDLRETFEAFENEKKLQRFSKLWGNEGDSEMIEKLKNEIVKVFGKSGDSFEYLEKHGCPAVDAIVEIKEKYEPKEYPDCIIQLEKEKGEYILYVQRQDTREGCSINLLREVEDISVFPVPNNIENKRVVITMKS